MFHDIAAAKVCAGWHTKVGDKIYGGFNPRLSDLGTDVPGFKRFCVELFKSNQSKLPPSLVHLLGLTVLRHYDDFLSTMKLYRKWNEQPESHIFIARVKSSLTACGISGETFDLWKKGVKDNFLSRNWYARPLSELSFDGEGNGVCIDCRPLLTYVQELGTKYHCLAQQQATMVTEMRSHSSLIQSLLQRMDDFLSTLVPSVPPQVQQLSQAIAPACNKPTVVPFHVLISKYNHKTQLSPDTLFAIWFEEDLPLSYDLTRSSELGKVDLAKLGTKFSTWKSAMTVLLKFVETYPPEKPDPGTKEWKIWHRQLKRRAFQAVESTKLVLQLKSVSINTLKQKKSSVSGKAWPPGMGEADKKWFENSGNNPSGKKRKTPPGSDGDDSNPSSNNTSTKKRKSPPSSDGDHSIAVAPPPPVGTDNANI